MSDGNSIMKHFAAYTVVKAGFLFGMIKQVGMSKEALQVWQFTFTPGGLFSFLIPGNEIGWYLMSVQGISFDFQPINWPQSGQLQVENK